MNKKIFFLPALTLVTDIFFLIIAYLFSFWIRFSSGILPVTKGVPILQSYFVSLILIVLSYIIIFNLFFLYQKGRISDEYCKIFKATSLVFFIFMTFTFIQREVSYSRLFIFISFFSSFLFASFGRCFINSFKKSLYRRGLFLTPVLLLCDKKYDSLLQQKIHREDGYVVRAVLGFSKLKDIPEIIHRYAIEEIIIHPPEKQYVNIQEIMNICGCDVLYRVIPQTSDILTKKIIPEQIGKQIVFTIRETPLKGMRRFTKRSFDIVFSLTAIIVFSPIFLIMAIIIKMTSSGTIFYLQERVSYNNKPFILYKFRTMTQDAEQYTGPTWAKENDPRITKTGRFLRQTNLDELPQLFNVLKGDMSLVGPRPERPFFIQQFKDKIPHYLERHAVKGGMTGWAQVNGYYGNTSLEERIKHDIFYIENWSFFFDIKILFRTLRHIFLRGR